MAYACSNASRDPGLVPIRTGRRRNSLFTGSAIIVNEILVSPYCIEGGPGRAIIERDFLPIGRRGGRFALALAICYKSGRSD
jgi:hypothetical protein